MWVKVYFPNGRVLAFFENSDNHGRWLKKFNVARDAIGPHGGRESAITMRLWHGKKSAYRFINFTLVR